MRDIQYEESTRIIPIHIFHKCLETGLSKDEIFKKYPKREDGAYYLDKFQNNLLNFSGMSLIEYCEKHFDFKWPLCPIRNQKVNYKVSGKGVELKQFTKGGIGREFSPKFEEFCRKMSVERKGASNPMFGGTPWNKGLGIEDERVKKIADSRRGLKTSDEVKAKQSESAKKRKVHGHTGKKHSEETKEKLRLNTAKLWASGVFNRASSIHLKMRDFLNDLELEFEEEHQVKYFSFDFAFPEKKIAIECQGQFFHVDPRIYPNGPICAIQRRNFGRDIAKRKVCSGQEGWTIIEIWEAEINDGSFKEQLKCKLLELGILKD